ncbi:MAG: sugar transferase [Bacteroidales bacterium]|jgi:lipopolysaccharide/colanic/teichoic acid biosynthesis glycosyltransferase|nr:sugar transferase [Bacteroidales bacterium]
MYNLLKRFFDILISFTAIVILSPLLIIIIVVLLLTGEHEVFYFQKRIGYKNSYFYIWKFATMLKNSPKMGGGYITTRNDFRVLPFGRVLRKTKINELPQLINILKGDMSIVGPRPMVDETFKGFPEEIRYKVFDSKPGLTGIGSIVFRDEEDYVSRAKNSVSFYNEVIQPYKAELELWYGKNKNLWVDSKIIFFTAWNILLPKSQLIYKTFKSLPYKNLEQTLL